MTFTQQLVERVGWYCKSWQRYRLSELASYWKFFRKSGEDMETARKAIIQEVERTYTTKHDGDSRTSNYIWTAEPLVGLGELIGVDFLYLVRPYLAEGIVINFRKGLSYMIDGGVYGGTMLNEIEELILLARTAEYDISVQLQDFLNAYRQIAALCSKLNTEKMEELIASYSPLPGDEPFIVRFTVRDSMAERLEKHRADNYPRVKELREQLATLPAGVA